MVEEIIIQRDKGKVITNIVTLILSILVFALAIIAYFIDIGLDVTGMPFIAVIISFIFEVILIYGLVTQIKEVINPNPLLIVNSQGIQEFISEKPLDIIRWSDIKELKKKYVDEQIVGAGLILKHPEKYIEDENRLKNLNELIAKDDGMHVYIYIYSIYSDVDIYRVCTLIEKYLEMYKEMGW